MGLELFHCMGLECIGRVFLVALHRGRLFILDGGLSLD